MSRPRRVDAVPCAVPSTFRPDAAAAVTTTSTNPPAEAPTPGRGARPSADDARVPRLAMLALATLALVLCVLAMRSGRDRVSSADALIDFGGASFDAIVTAPTEPEAFTNTSIWTLQSQNVALFPTASGVPTARFADTTTAGLFGLEGEGGLVALALVPAGLGEPVPEVFISPASTAVALAGLHPDLTVADPETRLARLVRVAQHPSIGELAARVDGATPLTQWTREDRELLARIVSDVTGLPVGVGVCPGEELVEGSLRRCGDQVANSSVTSALVGDTNGVPCALLPPAIERVTDAGRAAMRDLVTSGVVPDPLTPLTEPITARPVDIREDCGDDVQVFVDADLNPEWASTAIAYRLWADDVLPLAQLLGADRVGVTVDRETTMLVRSQEIAGGGLPTAFERLRVSSAHLRTPSTAPDVGLLPVSDATAGRLRSLTELLGELYR